MEVVICLLVFLSTLVGTITATWLESIFSNYIPSPLSSKNPIGQTELKLSSNGFRTSVPMYYINLDRSIYRRQHMEKVFGDWGSLTRVRAIDGSNETDIRQNINLNGMSIKDYNIRVKTRGSSMLLAASHVNAIRLAYEANDEAAIIFEDDVSDVLAPFWTMSIEGVVKEANERFEKDWDILRLQVTSGDAEYNLWKKNPSFHIFRAPPGWGTVAYLINRQGMKKAVSYFIKDGKFDCLSAVEKLGGSCVSDTMLWKIPLVKTYIVSPIMFVQLFNEGSTGLRGVKVVTKETGEQNDQALYHSKCYCRALLSNVEAFHRFNERYRLEHGNDEEQKAVVTGNTEQFNRTQETNLPSFSALCG